MASHFRTACWSAVLIAFLTCGFADGAVDKDALYVGVAAHAFDHLGDIADQAPAAAACGSTVIYSTGFGWMYNGMRPADQMKQAGDAIAGYLSNARKDGIRLAFGYVCATSIVDLPGFDRNWPPGFRAQFTTPPAHWLQQDRDGRPLPSWYGGDYRPACMNNPDWRAYEKYVVRRQLEAGFDGIFFDNPTVHPQGCFCPHCMEKFQQFLSAAGKPDLSKTSLAELRELAGGRPTDFLRFRATIASDFLEDMRRYARGIKPEALVTCNNSLNSPEVLFSQCRTYGYNIDELSRVEDLVVVEDMVSQPRSLPDGTRLEYGPVYELLTAISHGKRVVAITLAEGDYHTAPNLTRLAMSEAAAHGCSYLLWPTWPQDVREKMIAAVRPEVDLLRENAAVLNGARPRADVVLLLPFDRWTNTPQCRELQLARRLAAANVQFAAVKDDQLEGALDPVRTRVLLVESEAVLIEPVKRLVEHFRGAGGRVVFAADADWLEKVEKLVDRPSVRVTGPSSLRVVVRDQPVKTAVHLLNLNVRRVSSYEDVVTAADHVTLELRVPFAKVHEVKAISADPQATRGQIPFTLVTDPTGSVVRLEVPRVVVGTILVIQ